MKKGAVKHKDSWLMPGSTALDLYNQLASATDPSVKKLIQQKFNSHITQVNLNAKARGEF